MTQPSGVPLPALRVLLPVLLAVTRLAGWLALRRERSGRNGTPALAVCLVLLVLAGVGIAGMPPYGRALWEFARLPWRALLAS